MKLTQNRITQFRRFIFHWWKNNRRDLPWRHTHDPYKILVSEVMLQQTQVSRVLAKYREFIERYPTANSLAKGSVADVLRLWKGMGYNRRALYLKKAAEIGKFPKSEKELVKLPGVGTYTARAILVFAYGEDEPLVDTNIRHIITHFFFADKPQKERVIEDIARQLLPRGRSWQWHQALMDYGALRRFAPQGKPLQSSIPFRESNRFYRGRVMDLLRERSYSEGKLLELLTTSYNKPEKFFKKIIDGLEKDGLLIHSRENNIQLPV